MYTYTAENQLQLLAGVFALSYDPVGRLLKTSTLTVATHFGYDGADLIAEYDVSNAITRRYVHGPGDDEAFLWYEGTGLTDKRYLMSDERGSITSITDGAGAILGINRYDEYGIPAATNMGRFQYTGQTWLPEVGLYNYKARMYSPTLGRFMQTDPIGYGDGMNWYNYVGSDPVNGRDPSGAAADIIVIGTPNRPPTYLPPPRSQGSLVAPPARGGSAPPPLGVPTSRPNGHVYNVPTTKVCDAAKTKCDIKKVDSDVCVVPGATSMSRIQSGSLYAVRVFPSKVPTGFVRTTKDSSGTLFTNRTTLIHPLSGTVTRKFSQDSSGSIYVTTRGTGDAWLPTDTINEVAGPPLFQLQNTLCARYLSR